MLRPPKSTLFPYTTLFRSNEEGIPRLRVNSLYRSLLRSSGAASRSEEHTSELQSRGQIVCRLLLEKKKQKARHRNHTSANQPEYPAHGLQASRYTRTTLHA